MANCALHGDYPDFYLSCPSCDDMRSNNKGNGGGGCILALVALPFVVYGLPFVMAAFPMAGILTFLTVLLLSPSAISALSTTAIPALDATALHNIVLLALPCFIVFCLGLWAESKAEAWAPYRFLRHIVRVVGFGYSTNRVLIPWLMPHRPNTPWSPVQILLILAVIVGAHFGFRALDRHNGYRTDAPLRWLRTLKNDDSDVAGSNILLENRVRATWMDGKHYVYVTVLS